LAEIFYIRKAQFNTLRNSVRVIQEFKFLDLDEIRSYFQQSLFESITESREHILKWVLFQPQRDVLCRIYCGAFLNGNSFSEPRNRIYI
jgi:hypothetical protein